MLGAGFSGEAVEFGCVLPHFPLKAFKANADL
jgi:hypothetical protein